MLTISSLSVAFQDKTVVNNVSFDVQENSVLGIIGESGSGKSITALSILNLVSFYGGKIVSGNVFFEGKNIFEMSERDLQSIRGNDISMIFQDPFSSLNPSFTIFDQLNEVLIAHTSLNITARKSHCLEYLKKVHMPHPHSVLKKYPHELSGGMRQRVMIAMALISKPKLIIADEPTTALDVTVQKEILDLLLEIKKEENLTMIFISHDLGVVKYIADKIVVMYRSEVVEMGDVNAVLENPQHVHTRELVACREKLFL